MESEIQINNTAGVCQIDIEGTIGVPEEWQFEEPDARVATYERFRDTLRRIAEIEAPEVVVNIRSTGCEKSVLPLQSVSGPAPKNSPSGSIQTLRVASSV